MLERRCLRCHDGATPDGGFSIRTREAMMRGGESGPAILPGRPDDSLLVEYISGEEPTMPKGGPRLDAAQVASVRQWIADGALWPDGVELNGVPSRDLDWWSLRPLDEVAIPRSDGRWGRTPIDAFVLQKLHAEGLAPSPEADRRTLLRRLYFDLIGLPPTPEETERFLADESSDAYEDLVDRLLASPRYGERWGRHWLDVARYADSHG
jgi:hypothetical protein